MSGQAEAGPVRNVWIGRTVLVLMLVVFCWSKGVPALRNIRDSWSAAGWPTTPAVVTVSQAQTARNRKGGRRRTYRFEYQYLVGGQRWTGTRYSLADAGGDPASGCERFRRGEQIVVRYHPGHPHRSVVTVATGLFWNYLTVVTLLFVAFALSTMAWARIQKRRRRQ